MELSLKAGKIHIKVTGLYMVRDGDRPTIMFLQKTLDGLAAVGGSASLHLNY